MANEENDKKAFEDTIKETNNIETDNSCTYRKTILDTIPVTDKGTITDTIIIT